MKKSCSIEQLFFVQETGRLFVATVTFDRTLIFVLVAAQTEGVAFLHIPFLVCREVRVLMAEIACILVLMFGVGEHGGLLARLGFQDDLGRSSRRGLLTFSFILVSFSAMGGTHKNQQACEC